MASPNGPGGLEAKTFCAFCGYTDAQAFTFCPRCGRPTSEQMTLNEQTRPSLPLPPDAGATFGDAPTQAATGAQAPVAGGVGPYTTRSLSGDVTMAGGATGSYPQGGQYSSGSVSAPPKRPWSARRRVSVIVGGLLALLIVGSVSAYVVYTAFFAYSPVDSARYLPATTLFYSSFDLQQVAQNSHHVTQDDVAGTTNTSGFEQATGLDFQKDVVPWVKRSFSFSLVDVTRQPAPGGFGTRTVFETVFLISTHDVNASNAAIQKIITNQEQKYGVKFTTISYQGTTLESDVDSAQSQQRLGKPSPLVLGIVKDQVIIANAVAVAEQVVDRAKGNGDTLAQDATFSAAMGKLPDDRFGTLYVNLRQFLRDLVGAGAAASANDYPVGYGALQFTQAGMRLSFTLEAKAGTHIKYDLNGDTNASAAVTPANAILFTGLGNLNGFYQQARDASGGIVNDAGFRKAFGLGPDDPLFHAPLSVALLPPAAGSDDVVDPLVMLHASVDAATASAKIKQAVETLGYATSSQTVHGTTVTVIHASRPVYYTLLGRDLVFAYDADGIGQAIDTYQGRLASLAELSTFKDLVAQAPTNNALTLFISLDNLAKAPGKLGDTYRQLVKQEGILSKATADYLTYRSDDSGITITEDIALK